MSCTRLFSLLSGVAAVVSLAQAVAASPREGRTEPLPAMTGSGTPPLAKSPPAPGPRRRIGARALNATSGARSIERRLGAFVQTKNAIQRRYLAKESVSNPRMTAFGALVERSGRADALSGFKVVGLQHLVDNTGGLLRALADSGADPRKMLILGKIYSQSREVADDLRRDGFGVHLAEFESENDIRFGPMGPTSAAKNNREVEILNQLDAITARTLGPTGAPVYDCSHRYLVIDDGGELIELIHKNYPELHDRIVAVEQTRKGIRRIEKLGVRFPVIDVAQSDAKLKYESPMIGRALAKSTRARLDRISKQGFAVGKKILLLGYGAVGAEAARALREAGYEVQVFDKEPGTRSQARADGFQVFDRQHDALADARIVLSATGTTTLDGPALEQLPHGAILLNGASSSTEIVPNLADLLRVGQWPRATGSPTEGQLSTTFLGRPFTMGRYRLGEPPSQQDYVVKLRGGKEFVLVNQGQVINFDGSPGIIAPRYMQLTIGLLYMGAMQAARTTAPGIHPLDPNGQRDYLQTVQSDLSSTGESLEHPTF